MTRAETSSRAEVSPSHPNKQTESRNFACRADDPEVLRTALRNDQGTERRPHGKAEIHEGSDKLLRAIARAARAVRMTTRDQAGGLKECHQDFYLQDT
jgi:hypothetical protein